MVGTFALLADLTLVYLPSITVFLRSDAATTTSSAVCFNLVWLLFNGSIYFVEKRIATTTELLHADNAARHDRRW